MKVVIFQIGYGPHMMIPVSKMQALADVLESSEGLDFRYEGGRVFYTKCEVKTEIAVVDSSDVYDTKEEGITDLEQRGKLSEEFLDKRKAERLAKGIGDDIPKPSLDA
jgi:hypothetical protein